MGTKYDQLKVTQGATLGGTLNIDLGFTPTVGQQFTILTASSVSDTFATINGLAINGSEHFAVTYNAGSVVLTVVSGALPASAPTTGLASALRTHPPFHLTSGAKEHYGFEVFSSEIEQLPLASQKASLARSETVSFGHPSAALRQLPTMSPAFSVARTPVLFPAATLAAPQVSLGIAAAGMREFQPMAQPTVASAPFSGDASGIASSRIFSPLAAARGTSGTNHMRLECGVDLKALLKIPRKRLLKGLWAAPDSPNALAIGYMTYIGSH